MMVLSANFWAIWFSSSAYKAIGTQLCLNIPTFTMLLKTVLGAAIMAVTALAQPNNGTNTTYVGPENGHLVIVGGNLQSDSI